MTTREQRQAEYERSMREYIQSPRPWMYGDDTGRYTLTGDRVIGTTPTREDPNP